jgi:hypothetical protein
VSSGVALAMLPVAQDYKRVLIVDGAVADSITGDKWNRYIFRVDRNSSMDAISNALSIGKPGVVVATLAQDYAFGRDGVKAFKDSIKKAKVVHEEYLPQNTSDFTAGGQRIIDALKDKPGRKIIYFYWAGAGNPLIIRAYTFIPKNLDRAKQQPLIVFAHQGVHANQDTRDAHVFRELLVQGYSIVSADYRGSTGYGRGFYEQIDYGGREVEDVYLAGQWMLESAKRHFGNAMNLGGDDGQQQRREWGHGSLG